ncbi:hypothetical protein FPOAC2_10319 [Fusarium poae]|jgi:hypothetical protein
MAAGNRILCSGRVCMCHNDPDLEGKRGRPRVFNDDDLDRIEDLLEDEGFEARQLPWASVPAEAGIDKEASDRTIQVLAAS